ncbi:MAG: ERCC4 domain-containing protein [Thermoplasmata archaeon]
MVDLTMDVHEPKTIARYLEEFKVPFTKRRITPGDYVVGEVGIERKTLGDFFNSMVTRRLFDQVIRLKSCYPTSVLIVEGDLSDICAHRNPAAFWGAFLAMVMDDNVSILFSPNKLETARILRTFWRRQERGPNNYGLRHKPKMLTLEERQVFLIQGFPNVGDTLSRSLLEKFGSVRRVMMASKEELMEVPKIGEKKAEVMARILDGEYGQNQSVGQHDRMGSRG